MANWKKIGNGSWNLSNTAYLLEIFEDTPDTITVETIQILNEINFTEGQKGEIYQPIMTQSLEFSLISGSVTERMRAAGKNKIYVNFSINNKSVFQGYTQNEFNEYIWYKSTKRAERFFCTSLINYLKEITTENLVANNRYLFGVPTLIKQLQFIIHQCGLEQDIYCGTTAIEDNASNVNPSDEIRHDYIIVYEYTNVENHFELLSRLLQNYHLQLYYYDNAYYAIDRKLYNGPLSDQGIPLDKLRASDNSLSSPTFFSRNQIPILSKPEPSIAIQSSSVSSIVTETPFSQPEEINKLVSDYLLDGGVSFISGTSAVRLSDSYTFDFNAQKNINYAEKETGYIYFDGDRFEIDADIDLKVSSGSTDGSYELWWATIFEIDAASDSVVSSEIAKTSIVLSGSSGQTINLASLPYSKVVTGDPKYFKIRIHKRGSVDSELDYVDVNSVNINGKKITGGILRKVVSESDNTGEVIDRKSRLNSFDVTMLREYVNDGPSRSASAPIQYYDGSGWKDSESFDGLSFQGYISKLIISEQYSPRIGIRAYTKPNEFFSMMNSGVYNVDGFKIFVPSYRNLRLGDKKKHLIEMFSVTYTTTGITTNVVYEVE